MAASRPDPSLHHESRERPWRPGWSTRGHTAPVSKSATLQRLIDYPWPGNVRELENEVRRLAILSSGEVIGPEMLSPHIREGTVLRVGEAPTEVRLLSEVERDAILNAMRQLDGHRGKVATALGISRSTLYLKLKKIGFTESSTNLD